MKTGEIVLISGFFLLLMGCGVSENTEVPDENAPGIPAEIDSRSPRVSYTTPAHKEFDVSPSQTIAIQFTKPMDVSSAPSITVVDASTGSEIEGSFISVGTTLLFDPIEDLNAKTVRVEISKEMQDLDGISMNKDYAFNYVFQFTTGDVAPSDETLPRVTLATADIFENAIVVVWFNKAMDPSYFFDGSVKLRKTTPENSLVELTAVNYFNQAIVLKTIDRLVEDTYELVIDKSAVDLVGNSLEEYRLNVLAQGASGSDFSIEGREPNEDIVSLEGVVQVVFSEKINPLSITSANFELRKSGTGELVVGVVGPFLNGEIRSDAIEFKSLAPLESSTEYRVHIKNIESLSGNRISDTKWEFATKSAFYVEEITPNDNAEVDVDLSEVSVVFNNAVKKDTITTDSFRVVLRADDQPIEGNFEFFDEDKRVVFTFNDNVDLAYNTVYDVILQPSILDINGNVSGISDFSISFVTVQGGRLKIESAR